MTSSANGLPFVRVDRSALVVTENGTLPNGALDRPAFADAGRFIKRLARLAQEAFF